MALSEPTNKQKFFSFFERTLDDLSPEQKIAKIYLALNSVRLRLHYVYTKCLNLPSEYRKMATRFHERNQFPDPKAVEASRISRLGPQNLEAEMEMWFYFEEMLRDEIDQLGEIDTLEKIIEKLELKMRLCGKLGRGRAPT